MDELNVNENVALQAETENPVEVEAAVETDDQSAIASNGSALAVAAVAFVGGMLFHKVARPAVRKVKAAIDKKIEAKKAKKEAAENTEDKSKETE